MRFARHLLADAAVQSLKLYLTYDSQISFPFVHKTSSSYSFKEAVVEPIAVVTTPPR